MMSFSSSSAGPSSQPAGCVQHPHLSVSQLGQTPHRKRRHPQLQAVLHRQNRRERTGTSFQNKMKDFHIFGTKNCVKNKIKPIF